MEDGMDGNKPDLKATWLWHWGVRSWLFLGLAAALVVAWMAYSKAHQVVLPLVVAFILGILLEPFIDLQARHRIPRWLAVVFTMIIAVAVIALFLTVVIYGISTQAGSIQQQAERGIEKVKSWFEGLKVGSSFANWVHDSIERAWPNVSTGLMGLFTETVPGIASFAVGTFIGFFILIFILGDDGRIREWVAGHMGVPRSEAAIILDGTKESIRGYFKGTLIIATVDALLFIPIVLILGVPLLWPIVLVTFVTCFIPSFGGYLGGAFAVFIALASQGPVAGLVMLVFAILVHTVLQNPVQAIAYGKTLQLHPLAALLATLLGAVFAGVAGAVLAAPLTAAVIKVSSEMKKARAAEELLSDEGAPAG